MSQAMLLRIVALERKVLDLETRLEFLAPFTDGPKYRAVHKGFGHWFAVGPGDVKINTEGFSKDEALALADELNQQTQDLAV